MIWQLRLTLKTARHIARGYARVREASTRKDWRLSAGYVPVGAGAPRTGGGRGTGVGRSGSFYFPAYLMGEDRLVWLSSAGYEYDDPPGRDVLPVERRKKGNGSRGLVGAGRKGTLRNRRITPFIKSKDESMHDQLFRMLRHGVRAWGFISRGRGVIALCQGESDCDCPDEHSPIEVWARVTACGCHASGCGGTLTAWVEIPF